MHLNIKSLNKNYDNLIELLSKLSLQVQPHIISLITETKIKHKRLINDQYSRIHFSSCKFYHKYWRWGVSIFDMLQFKKLTLQETFTGSENLWTNITCPGTNINYIVGTIYSHLGSNAIEYCDYIDGILTELNLNRKNYFLLGDMDIDISKINNCNKNYLIYVKLELLP